MNVDAQERLSDLITMVENSEHRIKRACIILNAVEEDLDEIRGVVAEIAMELQHRKEVTESAN
jgi:hypothetical protein